MKFKKNLLNLYNDVSWNAVSQQLIKSCSNFHQPVKKKNYKDLTVLHH